MIRPVITMHFVGDVLDYVAVDHPDLSVSTLHKHWGPGTIQKDIANDLVDPAVEKIFFRVLRLTEGPKFRPELQAFVWRAADWERIDEGRAVAVQRLLDAVADLHRLSVTLPATEQEVDVLRPGRFVRTSDNRQGVIQKVTDGGKWLIVDISGANVKFTRRKGNRYLECGKRDHELIL